MYFFCKKNKISTPKIYQKYNEVTNKKRKFVVKEKFGNSSKGLMIISNLKRKHFNRKNIVQDFIKGQEFLSCSIRSKKSTILSGAWCTNIRWKNFSSRAFKAQNSARKRNFISYY